MIEFEGKYCTAIVFTDELDTNAKDQIITLINHPAFEGSKVRIMPDVHAGAGCVIGFTAEMRDIVVPNLVGVDIGCGMLTTKLGKKDIDLQALDDFLRKKIPAGFSVNKELDTSLCNPTNEVEAFSEKVISTCGKIDINISRILRSIGSLGGGNHFIEVNEDDKGDKYLVIHSGSRNFGYRIADYHQKKAVGICASKGVKVEKSLAYLQGESKSEYMNDMTLAQEYASRNRQAILKKIMHVFLHIDPIQSFETIHNYIHPEDNIIRKGAISAYTNEKILIPLNMRDGSVLATGKGNPEWNYSAPHGAGRILSRTAAKSTLSMEKFKREMKGVFSTSVRKDTLDESPMAYKDKSVILDASGESIEIIDVIKPIYNFKA